MAPKIGDVIITKNSKTRGVIVDIFKNRTGSFRVLLALDNGERRWATVSA